MAMADYAKNPRASFDYEILETIEAGLILKGYQAKAIRNGKASIKGAYVKILNNRPLLIGAKIAPYQPANTPKEYKSDQDVQLLLSRSEISQLTGRTESQGITLVPLRIYTSKGKIKLLIGVARGKKKYDKREAIKKKDIARARQRGLEQY